MVGSNGTLTDSPNLTFNGTVLGINATSVNTTAYVNINSNGLKVDGVINNPLIGAVTQSLIDIAGGLQAYTASLKGQAIVSSSTQIQNYNLFAVTSSGNTFYGNQQITGSLSLSSGQFNVTTGSGALTSSLSFRHTTIDPITGNAILELRYRNNDVGPENNAWKFMASDSGVALVFEQEGVDRTLLSSNNAGDALIFRDTRLFGKGLTVDNELLVKQNAQITGSLIVVGGITGSLLATNGVVSSSNQLFELNNQTGSQGSINSVIGIVTASLNAYTASGATSTSNINSFTASQLAVNDLTLAVTSSLITQNTSQGLVNTLTSAVTQSLINQNTSQGLVNTLTSAVTQSLITIVGGLQSYTASLKSVAIVSSSNQLFELNNQTGSQNSINTLTSAVTSSLITQNTSQGLVNTLTSAVTQSLINQNTSQGLVNTLTSAVTSSLITIVGGLQSYTASLKNVSIVSSSNQLLELNNQTGSQNSINSGIATVTGSITNILTLLNIATASLNDYSQSLKAANIVSSSQQILNYNIFATTGSNTFTGSITVSGSMNLSGSVYGNVSIPAIASNTASVDISSANFFTLTLGSSVTTHISASNVRAGQSVNVLVTTGTNSTASFSTNIKQPSGSFYLPTSGSGNKDILSFVSFDASNLYLVAVNQMI